MSKANVELAKRVIDAFNRRDVDGIFECVNPDLEWFPATPVTLGSDALRGRAGIESYVREVSDTWEEYRVVGRDYRDLGDEVVVLSRVEGRGAGSGGLVDAGLRLSRRQNLAGQNVPRSRRGPEARLAPDTYYRAAPRCFDATPPTAPPRPTSIYAA
jgi:ketosteroid isomerase-like protein